MGTTCSLLEQKLDDRNLFFFRFFFIDLIDTFVSFMEKKPPWLLKKKQLLSSIIYLSVESASASYTLNGSKLLKFFENVFKEIR